MKTYEDGEKRALGCDERSVASCKIPLLWGGIILGNQEHCLRYKDTYRLSLIACYYEMLSLVTSLGDETAHSRHFMKD